MAVPQPLVEAYKAAHYIVFGEPDIILIVGEPNGELDALLDAHGAAAAAFVTAANPRGRRRRLVENVIAFHSLKNFLKKTRYVFFEGEGRDPTGGWRPEGSVLVIDIPLAEAAALGRRYEQNAIVFIERGHAPELLLLR